MACVDSTIVVNADCSVASTAVQSAVTVSREMPTITVAAILGIRPEIPTPTTEQNFTAGEVLHGHRATRVEGLQAFVCDGSNAGHLGTALGVTTGAALQGDTVTVRFSEELTEGTWAFTPGPVYVGAGGLLTQNVGGLAFVQQIGVALSATKVYIRPQLAFRLS